jgi:hypothetical protein
LTPWSRARSSGLARSPFGDQLLGGVGGNRGVTTIGIGADSFTEFLVQRRTANQDDVIIANALLFPWW